MTGTLSALLTEAAARLKDASDSPRLDAELLLAHAIGRERSYLHAHPESRPDPPEMQEFERLVTARGRGEPIAYLTSKREFWSLPLTVTPSTLIPRPETELLVELALERIPMGADFEILDLGTGSGALALALAKERPHSHVTATDQSPDALRVAISNAVRLGLNNVEFLEGDWFAPCGERRFQIIASNPPYVRDDDPHLTAGDVRFEPRTALAGGTDGLRDLRHIIGTSPAHLEMGGVLLLEHGQDQGEAVRTLLQAVGLTRIRTWHDMSGHERVSGGEWDGRLGK